MDSVSNDNVPVFSDDEKFSIGALGEMKILERVRHAFEKVSPPAPRGIGDDCAVLPTVPEKFSSAKKIPARLVTTDSLIFGKHFDETISPENAGKKLVRRNASDIAAMGGTPSDTVLAFVMSRDVSADWLEKFLRGVASACEENEIELSGGDVASAPLPHFFSATLALTGFSENPLPRVGASVGDTLFVTGTLGGSIRKKHFAFRPRIAEGKFLAALPSGSVHACIDVTDGLLKDHAALLPPNAHADFDFDALPVSDDARALGGDLVRRAFCDGEDYELLFAVPENFSEKLVELWQKNFPETQLSRIARIVPGTENPALAARLGNAHAYEHFR